MIETKSDFGGNRQLPYFKANLRLWSETEPLAPVVRGSRRQWTDVDVKGQIIPAKGRVRARIASRHYASTEDIKCDNIGDIVPVLSQWLDDIESGAPPIMTLAKTGKIEAFLWVAIFGYGEVATPDISAELDKRAKQAGVRILLENYTIGDEETGNPAKSFFGFATG